MGNKSSTELWADTYKVYEKELLSFDDEAAEKVQMGELDMMDEKAMAAFVRQYRQTINQDRASLVEAIFAQYGKNKERLGLSEVRAITKDAIKHGETHLSALLVKFNETAAMKAPGTGKGASILLMDLASKPFIEASLTRIRKDIAERIKNQLHELLSENNRLGEVVLYRVKKLAEKAEAETKVEGQPEEQKKEKEQKEKEDEAVPAKIDPKLTVSKDEFVPHFHAALCQALGMDQLIASTRAQFISFLDIEVRNIPERVAKSQGPTTIEAVDDSEDEGEKNPRGRSTAVSPVESNKSGDEDDEDDEEEDKSKEEETKEKKAETEKESEKETEKENEECDKKEDESTPSEDSKEAQTDSVPETETETVTSTETEQEKPSETVSETVTVSESSTDSTPSDSSSSDDAASSSAPADDSA